MPTLVLIRHAKTEGHGGDDHSRNLVDRGHAQSSTLGPQIEDLAAGAQVLMSSANRAVQTWEGIALGLKGKTGSVEIADDLYTFDGRDLLERIGELAEGETVIVVGHNPAVSAVAAVLLGSYPPEDPTLASGGALRTARGVVLDVPDWSDLGPGTATLRRWLVPAVD